MSCSTDLFCNISFLGKTYATRRDVEDDIEIADNLIADAKNQLIALAACNDVKTMLRTSDCEGEEMDAVDVLTTKIDKLLNQINNNTCERHDLMRLLDNWDFCHDKKGKPINPPQRLYYGRAFISGDYI